MALQRSVAGRADDAWLDGIPAVADYRPHQHGQASGTSSYEVQYQSSPSITRACADGDCNSVEVLLRRGASLTGIRDADGYTPLMTASVNGRADVVELLVRYHADCDAEIGMASSYIAEGTTALMMAASTNHVIVVRTLLRACASLGIRNGTGRTALQYAEANQHNECVHAIREHVQAIAAMAAAKRVAAEFEEAEATRRAEVERAVVKAARQQQKRQRQKDKRQRALLRAQLAEADASASSAAESSCLSEADAEVATEADTVAAAATEAAAAAAVVAAEAEAAAAEVEGVAERMAKATFAEPMTTSASDDEGEWLRPHEETCCVVCGETPREVSTVVRHRGPGHLLCYCLSCALSERDRGQACPICRITFDTIVSRHVR